jgi:hypothetical protein
VSSEPPPPLPTGSRKSAGCCAWRRATIATPGPAASREHGVSSRRRQAWRLPRGTRRPAAPFRGPGPCGGVGRRRNDHAGPRRAAADGGRATRCGIVQRRAPVLACASLALPGRLGTCVGGPHKPRGACFSGEQGRSMHGMGAPSGAAPGWPTRARARASRAEAFKTSPRELDPARAARGDVPEQDAGVEGRDHQESPTHREARDRDVLGPRGCETCPVFAVAAHHAERAGEQVEPALLVERDRVERRGWQLPGEARLRPSRGSRATTVDFGRRAPDREAKGRPRAPARERLEPGGWEAP